MVFGRCIMKYIQNQNSMFLLKYFISLTHLNHIMLLQFGSLYGKNANFSGEKKSTDSLINSFRQELIVKCAIQLRQNDSRHSITNALFLLMILIFKKFFTCTINLLKLTLMHCDFFNFIKLMHIKIKFMFSWLQWDVLKLYIAISN